MFDTFFCFPAFKWNHFMITHIFQTIILIFFVFNIIFVDTFSDCSSWKDFIIERTFQTIIFIIVVFNTMLWVIHTFIFLHCNEVLKWSHVLITYIFQTINFIFAVFNTFWQFAIQFYSDQTVQMNFCVPLVSVAQPRFNYKCWNSHASEFEWEDMFLLNIKCLVCVIDFHGLKQK